MSHLPLQLDVGTPLFFNTLMTFTFTPLRTPVPTTHVVTRTSFTFKIFNFFNVILTTRSQASSLTTSLTSKSSALWPYPDFSWPELIIPSLAYLVTRPESGGFLELSPQHLSSPYTLVNPLPVSTDHDPGLNNNVSSLLLYPGSWVLLEKAAEIHRLAPFQ